MARRTSNECVVLSVTEIVNAYADTEHTMSRLPVKYQAFRPTILSRIRLSRPQCVDQSVRSRFRRKTSRLGRRQLGWFRRARQSRNRSHPATSARTESEEGGRHCTPFAREPSGRPRIHPTVRRRVRQSAHGSLRPHRRKLRGPPSTCDVHRVRHSGLFTV